VLTRDPPQSGAMASWLADWKCLVLDDESAATCSTYFPVNLQLSGTKVRYNPSPPPFPLPTKAPAISGTSVVSWDPARDRSATVSQPGPSPRPSVKFEISALQTTDDDAIPRDTRTGTLVAVNVDVAAGRNDDSKDDFYALYSPRARL
jgi:hypothetical protein